MRWRRLREKYNEGKQDHFSDPYDYIRYLRSIGQRSEAREVEKILNRKAKEANDDEEATKNTSI